MIDEILLGDKATEEQANALHGLVVSALITQLTAFSQKRLVTEDGEMVVQIPPAFLAQCIKWLKDNAIDKPKTATKKTDTLKDAMPDMDELEQRNVVPFTRK